MNILSLIPLPGRIAAVALILIAIFAAGWQKGADHVQAKWEKADAAQIKAALAAEQAARDHEQSMNQKLQEAQDAAAKRETALRADAAAARAAAGGLRDTIAALRRGLPADTVDACRDTADAALSVFGECAARLGAVAEAADGHASDAQLCRDAWPE